MRVDRRAAIKKVPALRGRMVVNLFFEPSTRTRFSFETAEKWLSADSLNFAAKGSSVEKGESLLDTARNLEAMSPGPDRHPALLSGRAALPRPQPAGGRRQRGRRRARAPDAGAARRARRSAGDSGGSEGLQVAIAGDIAHSRVARSNIWLLTKMGREVAVCGAADAAAPRIEEMGVEATTDFDAALEGADVVMMLRMQLERQGALALPVHARVLHALRPRRAARLARREAGGASSCTPGR